MSNKKYVLFAGKVSAIVMAIGLFLPACTTPESSLADKKKYTQDDNTYRRKFEIAYEDGEKPLRYGYHYVVSRIPGAYRVRVFHPDKKVLTEEKTYSTSALTLLHGPFSSYWDNGSIRARGNYQFGRKHGNWLECEPGKGKSSSGSFVNHKKEGVWTQLDTNGLIESVYTWHDGMRHGKFFEYDTLGHKVNEGLYRSDTLIAELFKRSILQKPYLKVCEDPFLGDRYSCTDMTLMQKINTALKYPAEARHQEIEGSALAQWDILPDGSVANMRIPQGLCKEIEAECRKTLSEMPEWMPAKRDGVPVKYTMALPINFKL